MCAQTRPRFIPKEFLGNGVRTLVNSRANIPSTGVSTPPCQLFEYLVGPKPGSSRGVWPMTSTLLPVKRPHGAETSATLDTTTNVIRGSTSCGASKTRADESHVETSLPACVLSMKATWLERWNVHTMYETGRVAQVVQEMRRYNIQFLEIRESRLNGSGPLSQVERRSSPLQMKTRHMTTRMG